MRIFRSLFTREREFESRVHTDLTKVSRERLASVTEGLSNYQKSAFSELADEVGYSKIDDVSPNCNHEEFLLNADTILALSYVEHLIRDLWHRVTSYGYRGSLSKEFVYERIGKIRQILISEGLLWNVDIDETKKEIRFTPLESEAMEQIDREVQALAEEDLWKDALKGYNAAFERYLNGDFDDVLVKKLYYSVEEVLKIICVDELEWTDNREMSHGNYLDLLRKNNFYDANGITAPEINLLLDSMEKLVSKLGQDRKQRHAYHDRSYATLLIHQVGSYLYFLISRYDSY